MAAGGDGRPIFPFPSRTEGASAGGEAAAWSPPALTATETRYTRQLAEMEPYFHDDNSEDLSYSDLDSFPQFLIQRAEDVMSLHIDHNILIALPAEIGAFANLICLDISNNRMKSISSEICKLSQLRTLIARNNNFQLESIPKDFGQLKTLMVVNLSGNNLTEVPMQFTELPSLKCLYLGANRISSVPKEIGNLQNLEILYLGGNVLRCIPSEVGNIQSLVSLVLSDNHLESLPNSLARLWNLQSLSLHNNRLSTLPPEIIGLNIIELSLRNNPLVVRFVQEMTYEPPSLLELTGRVIKVKNVVYTHEDLPGNLVDYLNSAHQCVNPKCKGVFFTSRIEHVKFVDFCGKYRLPLLQYLCSPKCSSAPTIPYSSCESESEDELPVMSNRMKKVLLG